MDEVTLLSPDGDAIGVFPKDEVHTTQTPLHLAFSCHVLDEDGRLLVTRRALGKRTWPGVWTNSFCGHPRPGEDMTAAVHRRAQDELGLTITDVTLVLADYRYRAVDASGIVENEICPVHIARIAGTPSPDPDEVSEWAWVDPADFADAVATAPFAFSPWLVEQLPQLRALGAV
ncbi:isopentenyl-diphosphate Delta-isomerase [Microbacterium sp. C5A9]|uniref:isopentenyl-diphosphate Delta-isomerase n=1 Tax=Microbacterium sp. C5A9 TaxID=2736663 RepID=UPI001F52638D|nr:isopentenyl-diphosphate Delta-isomerase [Microbacterium sp. C5A9]MCI1019569.1 isopentenyl-diphosphate Delta-isomerase [Microbacterium sp. C5A9]